MFGYLQTTHTHDFILAIHIDGLGQYMSLVEYHTILRYLLRIPLFLDEFALFVIRCTW